MGSNVPHKGIIKAGRLSPVVWGNFPIRSAMAGLNGDGVNLRLNSGLDVAESPLEFSGTASVSSEDILLTTAASGGALASLASVTKMDISGRFAVECSLLPDTVANNHSGIFVGFSSSRAGIVDSDGIAALPAGCVGAIVCRDKESSTSDTLADDIQIGVNKVTGGDATTGSLTKSGTLLGAVTAVKVGLIHKGDGYVRLYLDDVFVKKAEIPEMFEGYAVVSVLAEVSAEKTLKIGSFFAAGVVD